MSSIEELERRLARVEDAMSVLRDSAAESRSETGYAVSQATDARRLASGASADVTQVQVAQRGHNRVLEALRKTQVEQGERIDQNFAEVKADVAELKVGVLQIVAMLEGLADRD